MSLIPQGENVLSFILQIFWYGLFIFMMFYSQKIQVWNMLREIQSNLGRFKLFKDEARKIAISTIKEIGKPKNDPTLKIDQFLEYAVVPPVDIDPAGIVWKLEHVLDMRDIRFKDEVKMMAPEASDSQIFNLEMTLGAALVLNLFYKFIRHFYLLGKKTMNLYVIMQVQMQLPLLLREAEGYANALKALPEGQPIGDGIGALVAARMMHLHKKEDIAKDTVMAKVPIEGRNAFIVKAEGPGANVGKPGEAIKRIIEKNKGKISMIIMIDAQQKLEGEDLGFVTGGVGAAIGGPGVEKYKIDEAILEQKIPINSVLIKVGHAEVISTIKKEIVDAADKAIERVKNLIIERTKTGDSIIIAGIGNTVGIGQ
jgi:hypothetical protein